MNKSKFASLIMLGAFSAGVASSSAISARVDSDFASTVDMSIGSHDESTDMESKFSDESAVAFDEIKIDTKTTTDEETQDASTDENDYTRNDAENLAKNKEDETDLPEDSAKENSENGDYIFFNNYKKQNVKKIRMVKGFTIAGVGSGAVSGATSFGISKLLNLSGNNKKDEPITNSTTDEDLITDDVNKKDKPTPDPNAEDNDGVKDHKTKTSELVVGGIFVVIFLIIIFFWFKESIFSREEEVKKDYLDDSFMKKFGHNMI